MDEAHSTRFPEHSQPIAEQCIFSDSSFRRCSANRHIAMDDVDMELCVTSTSGNYFVADALVIQVILSCPVLQVMLIAVTNMREQLDGLIALGFV